MRWLKLLKDNKAQLNLSTVGLLSAFFITIIITVIIFWQIATSVEGPTAQANATINTTTSMFGTVYGLLPIIGLVIVATIIIGIVIRGMTGVGK